MADDTLIVLCTCPDEASAEGIATALVEARLAACVNLLPQVRSIYRWEGRLEHSNEWLLLIKTGAKRYTALEQLIRELHPYELPEVIAVPVHTGLTDYLRWVDECTAIS